MYKTVLNLLQYKDRDFHHFVNPEKCTNIIQNVFGGCISWFYWAVYEVLGKLSNRK